MLKMKFEAPSELLKLIYDMIEDGFRIKKILMMYFLFLVIFL